MKRLMVICMFAVLLAGCDVAQQDTQQDTQNVNGRLYVWPQGTVSIIDDYDHLWYPLNLSDSFNSGGIISGMRVHCDLKPEPVSSRNPSFEEGWPVHIIFIEEIK